ncbi:gliding motility-associated C-terminal domain-containing protein [Flavobacterium sp.]|uniref:T9SS type B sorting domain-containing protein n=1 Tax=Flavobacterium sp. TaxID=239 RepID=UPI0038FD00CF
MIEKIFSPFKASVFSLVFILFFSTTNSNAQCAGNDNSISICDITIPANQTINLFSLLGGSPTLGGVWSDDSFSGGLNPITGILNVLQIHVSGIYTYTYTVSGVTGCADNTSVITVVIGSYPGVVQNGPACADLAAFNLFELFNYELGNLAPHTNGTWFNVTTGTPVSGFEINPSSYNVLVQTDYVFSYTLPAVGSCPAPAPVFVTLTLFPPVKSGIPIDLKLCSTVDFSLYTNINLYNMLAGEDPGGVWDEISGTNEIFGSDTTINVQNIYNTFGVGTYSFTYRITPLPPICDPKTTTVSVIIEDPVDYSGTILTVNSDICESQIATATYSAVLTQVPALIPNGSYVVTYTVTGQVMPFTTTVNFFGGIASFPINSLNFQAVGTYTVTITNIVATTSLSICLNPVTILPDTITISPTPNINAATLTVTPICQNSSATGILTGLSSLANGNYLITYNLSGANTATSQTAVITVIGGVSSFTIPANLLPNPGNTTVTITNILNIATTCTNVVTLPPVVFVINPLPVVSALSVNVNSVCSGQPVAVLLTGLGSLTNITITYNLTGANTAVNQTIILVVTGGNASFIIPQVVIPNTGITTITVTDLTNTGNACGTIVNNGFRSFSINPPLIAPTANNQNFCKTDNATIANLVPSGSQYQWFDSVTSTTVLAPTTVLLSGNYYIREINAITGCQSTRTMITVVINELNTPTLDPSGEQFCGLDNPTLQELSANTNTTGALIWFDAVTGGNQLPNTTLLQEGVTYYGFDFSNATNCFSVNGLAVTVSLTNCDTINPEVTYDFFIPDGFSPNGDGVNDTFTIPDIQFIFPNYTLDIYNRYGSLMFSGDKNKPNWDGKSSESPSLSNGIAPNGVYFYIVNFNKDNKSPRQGRLYLNR